MVKKRGPYDRIEKVVGKKRSFNQIHNTLNDSPPMKSRNILNDRLLSLYKAETSANEQSPVSNCSGGSDVIEKLRNDKGSVDSKDVLTLESSKPHRFKREKKSKGISIQHPTLTFKDVGGLDEIILELLEVFFYLRNPKVHSTLNVKRITGILFHGPAGCGKTHLVKAIAGQIGLPLIQVAATDLVGGISGESESQIRDVFDEAAKNAPCILFIDQLDIIAPKRDSTERNMEKRMVSQLLTSIDELNERHDSSGVMVIGATSQPDSIDPALREGLRFQREFAIGIPDEKTRLMILKVCTKNVKFSPDFDMEWLAHHTPGYVAGDLVLLIDRGVQFGLKRIYYNAVNMYLEDQKGDTVSNCTVKTYSHYSVEEVLSWFMLNKEIPQDELDTMQFEMQDFQSALKVVTPASKKEGFYGVPNVTWDNVGALKDVKKKLQVSFIWPVKYQKIYEHFHSESSKGLLLYGPKGCGKTLLAKAIANECSINFLSVKGPELLNMYLGESERAVRQCFQRARNCAPCIIFFDEMDAVCPKRADSNTNAAADRVVNMLLTEMNGIEERNQVYVIGTTNRLEKIDSAMLRPGRLDEVIYIGLPSPDDRVDILKSLTKDMKDISDDVNLETIGHDSRCENFSGADLSNLVFKANSAAIKEFLNSSHFSSSNISHLKIHLRHFEQAFSQVKPSNTKKELKYYERTRQKRCNSQ